MKPENPMKAALSVAQMCRLLKMSRSQFYLHVKRGTFHAPLRLASNQRPYFTASMVDDILRARETGVGVNREYVIFYERQPTSTKIEIKKFKTDQMALLEGLKALGLGTVTGQQVESALAACFPNGTSGHDDNMILKQIFRHLKSSGIG
jgi:predicted DNA-binding transcriptional regulator AlpA